MKRVPKLTKGRLTALWVVLRSASKLGKVVDHTELISFARKSGLRGGGLPISDGYELATLGGFLSGKDTVALSTLGADVLARCGEEEPSPEVLRIFLSVLLLRYPPAWVPYWQGDPSSFDIVLPEAMKEIMEDAELVSDGRLADVENWSLWNALQRVPQPEETAALRKAVGDAAEELSLGFERSRLRSEGYPALAERVRWVARESAAYGFDILSFVGKLSSAAPESHLAIEVKGQSLVARPVFSLYITSHEWRTAKALSDSYIFHLWHGVSREEGTIQAANSVPIVIRGSVFETHIPARPSCGARGDWYSAFVSFPIGDPSPDVRVDDVLFYR